MSARQSPLISYSLPNTAIALTPSYPRDAAKLLVYERETERMAIDTFRNLGRYLPANAVLVLNDTKVIPARLRLQKPSGGRVEVLCLDVGSPTIHALADRRLELGITLTLKEKPILKVLHHVESLYTFQVLIPVKKFQALLAHDGQTPLPPYLRHSPLTEGERRKMYQSVFAKNTGSVAAPTASLHFTPRLLRDLQRHRVHIEYVTLHVGLGTFAPVTNAQLRSGHLHHEHYQITPAAAARLNAAKKAGRPIIAVGTTVARTLESAARLSGGQARRGRIIPGEKTTDLFIRSGYAWKFVDGLVTNFHVPESSLLLLVASLIGRQKLLSLYQAALDGDFRFFSFGDGMLVI